MDDEQRARELATKLQDCVEVVRIGGGIERMFIDEHGIELLAAAFAEVRSDTFQDALKPLKRRLKIDAEFSEPGHDRWRHHKSRAEALGEAIDDVRALSAEPAAPDPTKPESQAPMEAAPLPCPFCGGPAMIAEYGDGQHIVFCASCDCHPSPEETASDALVSWNRRSSAPDPREALDSADDTCGYILFYADQDRADEHFSGEGAREAALARFNQQRSAWTVALFKEIARG